MLSSAFTQPTLISSHIGISPHKAHADLGPQRHWSTHGPHRPRPTHNPCCPQLAQTSAHTQPTQTCLHTAHTDLDPHTAHTDLGLDMAHTDSACTWPTQTLAHTAGSSQAASLPSTGSDFPTASTVTAITAAAAKPGPTPTQQARERAERQGQSLKEGHRKAVRAGQSHSTTGRVPPCRPGAWPRHGGWSRRPEPRQRPDGADQSTSQPMLGTGTHSTWATTTTHVAAGRVETLRGQVRPATAHRHPLRRLGWSALLPSTAVEATDCVGLGGS